MSLARGIFWSHGQGRLRTVWRLLPQLVLFLAILIGLALITDAIGPKLGKAVLGSFLSLAIGLGAVWLLARYIDHGPFADYGLHMDRA